jgi:hypothetical protein
LIAFRNSLDFTNFVTSVTSVTGACVDTFVITSPSGSLAPSICGTNTGYHSKHRNIFSGYFFVANLLTQCPQKEDMRQPDMAFLCREYAQIIGKMLESKSQPKSVGRLN